MNSCAVSSWVVGWRLRLLFAVVGLLFLGRAPAGAQVCVGDCNGNGTVSISELVKGVNIALDLALVSDCEAFANTAGQVSIGQLVKGVNNALGGCPSGATPTNTPPDGATSTPTEPEPTETPTDVPTPATSTPTATPTLAGPTATSTPRIESVAGGSVAVANVLSAIPNVVGSVVTAIVGGGGPTLALAGGEGAGAIDSCPLGGFIEQSGAIPNLTVTLDMCEVPRPGGSVIFDGGITLVITNIFALSGTATFDVTVIFKDATGATTLTTDADLSADVKLRVQVAPGQPCTFDVSIFLRDVQITGLELTLTGTLSSTTPGGAQATVLFTDTEMDVTVNEYGPDCVPTDYVLVLNGAASVTQDAGGGGGTGAGTSLAFDVLFADFTMDAQVVGNATEIDFSGTITATCFGGAITLLTPESVRLILGEFCPAAGHVEIQDLGDIFYSNGAVTVDVDGAVQNFPSCLAPELLRCQE